MENTDLNSRQFVSMAGKLLILACILSNVSQLPVLVTTGMTQWMNTPIWIVLLIYCFPKNLIRFNKGEIFIIVALCFIVSGGMVFEIITGQNYIGSSILTCMLMSSFIYFIGSFLGNRLNDVDLKIIVLSYAVSSIVVAIAVFVQYFAKGLNLSSSVYAYASKNSVSQILFSAIVVLTFIKLKGHKILNLFRIFGIAFLALLIVLLRSRATILGLGVCIVYVVFTRTSNKAVRKYVIILLVSILGIFAINDPLRNLFWNNILLAGRDITDLNSLTSGRVDILQSFPSLIQGKWLTGIGSIYFECFPLSAILNFGIVFGILIVALAYSPMYYGFKWKIYNEYTEMFFLICLGYITNSFFEGLAPIGPGVKCYFMWLMFGILREKMKNRGNHLTSLGWKML